MAAAFFVGHLHDFRIRQELFDERASASSGHGPDVGRSLAGRPHSGAQYAASGGVGAPEHFVQGAEAGATGLLAASVFHYGEFSIADAKAALAAAGLPVRRAPRSRRAA